MFQLDLKKIIGYKKTIYSPNDDYFLSVGLQRTNRKFGKIGILYQ